MATERRGRTTKGGSRKKGAGEKPPTTSRGGTAVGQADGNSADVVRAAERMMSNQQVRSAVRSVFRKRKDLEQKRSELNADIKALREQLVGRGLNKHAMDILYRYYKMDEAQRDGFDMSWLIGRESIGLPIQEALPLADAASPEKASTASDGDPAADDQDDGDHENTPPPDAGGGSDGETEQVETEEAEPA